MKPPRAFTLIELLMVMAVLGLLVALLLPAVSSAKLRARRATCSNSLRQINLGVLMYSADANDAAPRTPGAAEVTLSMIGYKKLIRSYVGLQGFSSPGAKLFACPADTFHYEDVTASCHFVPHSLWEQPVSDDSSYAFNGGNEMAGFGALGIAGRKVNSIKEPAKTVMVAEGAAYIPWSWHEPKRPFAPDNAKFNDAKNMVSFVDGHVVYLRIYWNATNRPNSLAMHYDPPAGYDYKWSGD
jgi:prepilin-type N-terminal cleavage/methylation domain-containing protein